MKIGSERQGEVLIITLSGRLDGFGSQELEIELKRLIKDDTRAVVLDMAEVTYLSSAGIRIFLWLRKMMKDRDGSVAIASLQDFPRSVLEMGGFMAVVSLYPSRQEAVMQVSRRRPGLSLLDPLTPPAKKTANGSYSLLSDSKSLSSLLVSGSLEKLLHSSLSRADIRDQSFSSVEYALGLGAIGGELDDAYDLLGEMIALHGSLVYMPTDGHRTPDFFTPMQDTGKVRIYTGFSVSLKGPFQKVFYVESADEAGISMKDLYSDLFSFARQEPERYHGILAMVLYGISGGVTSSEITRSPVTGNAPGAGRSILDPDQFGKWMDVNTDPRYQGDTLVSFGIGVDLGADLSSFRPEDLAALYYVHPANTAPEKMYLHNHGVIFSGVPWSAPPDLNDRVRKIVREGEFIDMRHLLDDTRVRKAYCGISFISGIEVSGP